ncbi:MAG: glycosyltransferase family 39 protein [Chthonomonadales bacterium]|nr:glycosyltransferase family 39 protein [Chthonomonadales bacterium]
MTRVEAGAPPTAPARAAGIRWIPAAVAAVVLLALFLRLYRIGEASIDEDEGFSLMDAAWPPRGANRLRPVYYALLHAWMLFGQSDGWLRSLAALMSVASVYLAYRLGARILGPATGLVGALVLALSPLSIMLAQMIRMYAPATSFALLGCLALLAFRDRPTWGRLLAWAAARVVMLLTAPATILLVPVDLALAWRQLRERLPLLGSRVFLAASVAALAAPALYVAKRMAGASDTWYNEWVVQPGFWSLLSLPAMLTAYWYAPYRYVEPHFPSSWLLWLFRLYTLALAGVIAAAVLGRGRRAAAPVLWWVGVPCAVFFVVSNLFVTLWVPRYLGFLAPFVALAAAAGFARVAVGSRAVAGLFAALYLGTVGIALTRMYASPIQPDMRGAAAIIRANARPGDIVVGNVPGQVFARYLPGVREHTLNMASNDDPLLRDPATGLTPPERAVRSLPATTGRIWIVFGQRPYFPRHTASGDRLREALDRRYRVRLDHGLNRARLFLLEPRAPAQRDAS